MKVLVESCTHRPRQLREVARQTANAIRFSETFEVPLPELTRGVKRHQLEGITAKRTGSQHRSGERCRGWLKRRAYSGQEFVMSGYVSNGCIKWPKGSDLAKSQPDWVTNARNSSPWQVRELAR
jgi:ATP-dependent DNA ligase